MSLTGACHGAGRRTVPGRAPVSLPSASNVPSSLNGPQPRQRLVVEATGKGKRVGVLADLLRRGRSEEHAGDARVGERERDRERRRRGVELTSKLRELAAGRRGLGDQGVVELPSGAARI